MKKKNALPYVILFPAVYCVFTAVCAFIGSSFSEHRYTVILIWYLATFFAWVVTGLIWMALIIKLIQLEKQNRNNDGKD